jgi:hypothetical protein
MQRNGSTASSSEISSGLSSALCGGDAHGAATQQMARMACSADYVIGKASCFQ